MRLIPLIILVCSTFFTWPQALAGESFRIVSQNMNRFFDDVDDGNDEKILSAKQFKQKVALASSKIVKQFRLPDIVALQEVENQNVLDHIVAAVFAETGIEYQVIIRQGNDVSGINIAYLVKSGRKIKSVRQLFKRNRLDYDASLLFSRPPLYLEVCKDSGCLLLLNLHLRSMRGMRSGSSAERVRLKRRDQASIIARWIEDLQQSGQRASFMLIGDFNALTPADSYVDVAGILRGKPDNSNVVIPAKDWISDDLTDLTREIPPKRRYSFIYRGNKQILDYMFINTAFEPRLENIEFTWIEYRFSDHAGLIADFDW